MTPRRTPPRAPPVRRMHWPRSRGKWAAEDCLPPSTARSSGPRAATTKVADSFVMVIRQAASTATRTAINTTGTKIRSPGVQGGDKYGATPKLGIALAHSQMGKSIFVTGKHMSYRHAIRIVFCGFFLCAITLPIRPAHGRWPHNRKNGDATTSASGKKDACILLTSAEVEAVQGEPVSETKTSAQPNGEMLITECVFRTTTFAKSVSLALVTASSAKPSALTPRKFWQKQFHASHMEEDEMRAKGKRAQNPEPEGEEEARRPRRIEGLGEDAYWVGTPVTGALYVLQGNNFVRISVGGVGEESARIGKSKVLARAVVKRLYPH